MLRPTLARAGYDWQLPKNAKPPCWTRTKSMLWRISWVVLAPLLLEVGTLTATAQSTSTNLVSADVLHQYTLIKEIIKGRPDIYNAPPSDRRAQYNLFDCGVSGLELGIHSSNDRTTSALSWIAANYYIWMTDLPAVGYPRALISPLIEDYERTLLGHITGKGAANVTYDIWHQEGMRLATAINNLRSRQHLTAAPIDYMDECGGHGTDVKFIIPTEAHMFMTSTFFGELCQKQGINRFDRVNCDRYVDVPNGTEDQYAGLYLYVGEWNDGYTRNGQIDVERLSEEGRFKVFRLSR